MWRAWLLFLFLASAANAQEPYADTLVKEAEQKDLHTERKWNALMHYRPNLFGAVESLVDDPDYFLSPVGKTDNKAELEATIRAFFTTEKTGDAHPRCKFPARYRWLKEELNIDEALLPKAECKELNDLMESLRPQTAILVFPVAHINSPASMFGHTLLRIDSDSESKMFSYAINYSAFTDETNGLFFALRGIFGFYEGFFALAPYYDAIKEYSNLESRDMWEYKLNLTKKEVEDVVLHMWELKDVFSYYYFFDENCSYNLLLALEAGRPSLDLIGSVPKWVIPVETIRAVRENNLLTDEFHYRPSKATRIRLIEGKSLPSSKTIARELSDGEKDPETVYLSDTPNDEKIRTLDLAAEYLQYNYSKKLVERERYLKDYLRILSFRSKLGKGEEYKPIEPLPPDKGHGPNRFYVGAGVKAGSSYTSIGLRPANHALMDPDEGYLPGASISFMDGELRYDFTGHKFSFQRLTLVEVISVSERSDFFKPISWKVTAGVEREEFAKREHRTNFRLYGGPGIAYRFLGNGFIYAYAEPELKVGGDLEDNYAFGAGVLAGVMKPVTDKWKVQLEARGVSFFAGEEHSVLSVDLNGRYTVNTSNAIKLNLKRERFESFYSTIIGASWNIYF